MCPVNSSCTGYGSTSSVRHTSSTCRPRLCPASPSAPLWYIKPFRRCSGLWMDGMGLGPPQRGQREERSGRPRVDRLVPVFRGERVLLRLIVPVPPALAEYRTQAREQAHAHAQSKYLVARLVLASRAHPLSLSHSPLVPSHRHKAYLTPEGGGAMCGSTAESGRGERERARRRRGGRCGCADRGRNRSAL